MADSLGMDTATRVDDNLIAGATNELFLPITTDTGAYVRGYVMGRNSTTDAWAGYDAGATDGTEVARGIMVSDFDSAGVTEKTKIYTWGTFQYIGLVWDDIADAAAGLISLQDNGLDVQMGEAADPA